VLEHFTKPHNMGELKNPDGVGKVGNPRCGDEMWIYIKIAKKRGEEVIKDIKFKTFGCVSAIATSSVLTDLVKGKTMEQALLVDNKNVAKALGGLPPIKMHCSVLAEEGLKAAIKDYKKRLKKV
ncbi:MAG: iron-sulfur cluster assembly scaffold protein, partial [Nanoarchaeota archaeon]|nr:iron-sulfur cluster assembly scaffold protein [Nanoarchaeota archaeon]